MNDNTSKILNIDIDEILPNRFQPRIQFNEDEILELSDSIKEHGVIQPIVVRTIGDKYEIIAGERRYKASVLAGKETVPVIIKNLNDKDSAEIALIENVQRKNLTPIEEALSYKKILDMGYLTQTDLAVKLGKSQSAVANKIRLLNLSDEVQEALLENRISERHARSLLRLETSKKQNEMLNKIITERLTVRRTDEEIDKIKENGTDEESGEEKLIEKGEMNMNNNMPGINPQPEIPSMPSFSIPGTPTAEPVASVPTVEPAAPVVEQPAMPSFDIFAPSTPATEPVASVPTVEPAAPVVEQPAMPSFDMFAPSTPTAEPVASVPTIEPAAPVVEQPAMPSFDMFAPSAPAAEPVASVPTIEPAAPVVEQPAIPSFEVPSMPAIESTVEAPVTPIGPGLPVDVEPQPSIPSFEVPSVPVTSPIVETPVQSEVVNEPVLEVPQSTNQLDENMFSFGPTPTVEPIVSAPVTEQPAMPEPIIITDYNKQYDPVMPQMMQAPTPTVDFKEVIAAIRECSSKIEQYGFKIDVEEYDLANLYQVIFKIEK